MTYLIFIISLIIIFLLFRFYSLGVKSGEMRPATLGVTGGQLNQCGDKPNCVCSQNTKPEAQIEPIKFEADATKIREAIKSFVQTNMNGKLIEEKSDYLYFEVTSGLFKFVDDLEFYFPNENPQIIQVRSASRVGYSDMGANRKRIETLRNFIKKGA